MGAQGAGHCPWGGYTDQMLCPLAAAEVVMDGHTEMETQKELQTIIMDSARWKQR